MSFRLAGVSRTVHKTLRVTLVSMKYMPDVKLAIMFDSEQRTGVFFQYENSTKTRVVMK